MNESERLSIPKRCLILWVESRDVVLKLIWPERVLWVGMSQTCDVQPTGIGLVHHIKLRVRTKRVSW